MIYLDSAATSLLKPPCVAQAMTAALTGLGNCGRGAHGSALDAARMVYHCRERLAELFHVPGGPSQIVFTGGATDSLNLAIGGLFSPGQHVITTALEHNSVLRPLYRLEAAGLELTILPADDKGRISLDQLEASFRPNTAGVVCTHASNLCGNALPVAEIGAIAHRHGALCVVDGAQSAGHLPLNLEIMDIDALCVPGHKGLMGPQGMGVLALRPGVYPRPLRVGGSGVQSFSKTHPTQMPTALEAGTLNGPGIAGLGAAVDWMLEQGQTTLHDREAALAQRFYEQVRTIPDVHLYGDFSDFARRAPVIALNLGDIDSGRVADALSTRFDIATRAGAHCAPLAHQTFGTVTQGAVRFSFSPFNTVEEVDQAAQALRVLAEE